MLKKIIGLSLGLVLFLTPALSLAGVYKACDIDPETRACKAGTETNVYYEGLVPCGKDVIVGIQLDENGDPMFDQDGHPLGGTKKEIPCQFCHLLAMINNLVKFTLIEIVPLVAVAMFVVAGIMFFTAGGSLDRLKSAKKLFTGIVIGLSIIYGAWLIVSVLMNLVGVAKWTGLQGGWYKIDCPIQLPADAIPAGAGNPSNPPNSGGNNPGNPLPPSP